MSGDEGQLLTAQEAAEAWDDDRREEHQVAQGARVRIVPARRTPEMEAYHEECRQKYLRWDPVKFGTIERGECVLIRCPRVWDGKCVFGSIDLDLLEAHFDATGHWDPEVDALDATVFNPVYAGEGPGHG